MPDENKDGKISALGVTLENVPRWALVLFSAALVIGVLVFGWWKGIREPEYQATLAKQARDLLQASVDEYGKHIAEAPVSSAVLVETPTERRTAASYADGCSIMTRTRNGRTRTKLILDIDFDPVPKAGTAISIDPTGWEIRDNIIEVTSIVLLAQGRCLDPHPPDHPPPAFRTWYGERRECWIQVWRQWRDGCQHFQWFDSCHNVWASNADGSPAVNWTSCRH